MSGFLPALRPSSQKPGHGSGIENQPGGEVVVRGTSKHILLRGEGRHGHTHIKLEGDRGSPEEDPLAQMGLNSRPGALDSTLVPSGPAALRCGEDLETSARHACRGP